MKGQQKQKQDLVTFSSFFYDFVLYIFAKITSRDSNFFLKYVFAFKIKNK